jgi:hypothetical protein
MNSSLSHCIPRAIRRAPKLLQLWPAAQPAQTSVKAGVKVGQRDGHSPKPQTCPRHFTSLCVQTPEGFPQLQTERVNIGDAGIKVFVAPLHFCDARDQGLCAPSLSAYWAKIDVRRS